MKTAIYQVYVLEKPAPVLLPGGGFTSNPTIDPRLIAGPVVIFATSAAVAQTKTMQNYAADIQGVDPNRLLVVAVPIVELPY